MDKKPKRVKRLAEDQAVTQYGNTAALVDGKVFREMPREDVDSDGLSVLLGRLQPHEAAVCIGRMPRGDVARWTTVQRLREAGFDVLHDPLPMNPLHALVKHNGVWDEVVGKRFAGCFEDDAEDEGGPEDG